MVLVLVLQVLQGIARLFEDFLAPDEQALAEVIPLALVHERLLVGRPVGFSVFPRHALRLHALNSLGRILGRNLGRISLSRRAYIGGAGAVQLRMTSDHRRPRPRGKAKGT